MGRGFLKERRRLRELAVMLWRARKQKMWFLGGAACGSFITGLAFCIGLELWK